MTKEKKIFIMLVEDDKFLRELLVRKLESAGFKISTAVDGQEAFRKTKDEMPDIVLLDLVLPGIEGFDILEQIRKDEKTKDIPVIILSNLGQKEEVDKGMQLGASDYLIKAHFTPDQIIKKVRDILGSK